MAGCNIPFNLWVWWSHDRQIQNMSGVVTPAEFKPMTLVMCTAVQGYNYKWNIATQDSHMYLKPSVRWLTEGQSITLGYNYTKQDCHPSS